MPKDSNPKQKPLGEAKIVHPILSVDTSGVSPAEFAEMVAAMRTAGQRFMSRRKTRQLLAELIPRYNSQVAIAANN